MRKKAGRTAASVILFLGGAALGALELLYRWKVVPAGVTWLYPWMEPLDIGLTVGCFGAAWLMWMKRRLALRAALAAVIFFAAFGLAWLLLGGGSSKVLRSPEGTHALVLEQGSSGAQISRIYRGLMKRPRQELEDKGDGQVKVQWLAEDVCAFTYLNGEGLTCQYLETMGDRGEGISYLDPLTAMGGVWGSADGTTVTLEGGEVVVTVQGETKVYQSEDCQRFGTLALTLCEKGFPRWSLIMNEDCQLNRDDRIAQGGTLTLCPVSLEETEPLLLEARDQRQPYGEDTLSAEETQPEETQPEETQEELEQRIVEKMQGLAAKNQPFPWDSDGIFYVAAEDPEEFWNVRTALRTYLESGRVSGVDVRAQIDSIQRLAGDDSDGLYQVRFTELCISPGNQGGGPQGEKGQMTYRIRMMKTAGGYCACIFHANEDGSWGLSGEPGEEQSFSDQEEYHFFLSGEYDTTYMYVNRRDPSQGMEAVYREMLAGDYPEAVAGEYDGMPCMDLAGDGTEYLLYDGISEDYQSYCYQRILLEDTELRGSSRMRVEESYQTPIIP